MKYVWALITGLLVGACLLTAAIAVTRFIVVWAFGYVMPSWVAAVIVVVMIWTAFMNGTSDRQEDVT